MQRTPRNRNVVRQLFPPDGTPEEKARLENFNNMVQEIMNRERQEIIQKYNFDIEIDRPLIGDNYEWFKKVGEEWIGVYKKETEVNCDEETDIGEKTPLMVKEENELTPTTKKDEEVLLLIRKRKKEDKEESNERGVRKRLSFD